MRNFSGWFFSETINSSPIKKGFMMLKKFPHLFSILLLYLGSMPIRQRGRKVFFRRRGSRWTRYPWAAPWYFARYDSRKFCSCLGVVRFFNEATKEWHNSYLAKLSLKALACRRQEFLPAYFKSTHIFKKQFKVN